MSNLERKHVGHWRGFTKYELPDGSFIAETDGTGDGNTLGPVRTIQELDTAIATFYDRKRSDPD